MKITEIGLTSVYIAEVRAYENASPINVEIGLAIVSTMIMKIIHARERTSVFAATFHHLPFTKCKLSLIDSLNVLSCKRK